jgi:hypothetical protein
MSRARGEDNIKIYFIKIDYDDMDWIHLAQDRNQWQDPMNMVIILQVL